MLIFKRHYLRSLLGILGLLLGLMVSVSSFAQATPPIGSLLTATEMTTIKTKAGVQDGKKTIWVLSAGGSASDPFTMVVNEQGIVGKSSNELLITNSPTTQTKLKIATYLSKTISVQYFDNMNTTVLRFPTLGDAAKASAELSTAMPDAQVSLPVTYSIKRPR